MVTGFVIGAFGFGAFIFGYVSLAIANPENSSPEYEVSGGNIFYPDQIQSERAPKMIRMNALIWTCMSVIGIVLIGKPSKDKEDVNIYTSSDNIDTLGQSDITENPSQIEPENEANQIKQYIPFKVAIKTFATWHL